MASNITRSSDNSQQPLTSRTALAAELAVHRTELEMQNHELRDAQLQLEVSRARYFSLFDLSPVPYLVIKQDFGIIEANLAAGELLQIDRARLIGSPAHRFADDTEREQWMVQLSRAFGDRRVHAFDSIIRTKAGSLCHVHLVCQTMSHDSGKPDGAMLVAIFDVTTRIEAERERQQLSQKLLETQKLESLGVLAGGIAHDFNNILTGVLTAASLLKDEVQTNANALALAEQIEKSGRRTADLCRQLLAYAGKAHLTMKPLRVNPLITDLLTLLGASLPKKHRLVFHSATYLPAIVGDATQIRQVIMNLVVNASEAIGEKEGEVIIRTGVESILPKALMGLATGADLPAGNYVYTEVSDNGCGMSLATISRIFDPFYTTKFTGRGLGLAAVLGIIRSHKGVLLVRSEIGKGSCFRLWLPVSETTAGAIPEEEKPIVMRRDNLEGACVLVIDDEPIVRKVLEDMLKQLKCKGVFADTGQDAVGILKHLVAPPDIILLDLTMPGWDGPQTFAAIREQGYKGPIFLMSGYATDEVSNRLAHLDVNGFVQKPILVNELTDKIRSTLLSKPAKHSPKKS